MSAFDRVTKKWGDLKYMKEPQARFIGDMIRKHKLFDVLEMGFFHGKSSAYIAAILEDVGAGHLTTIDLKGGEKRSPNIHNVLADVALSHRVTPIFASRSYTWEFAKMLMKTDQPRFDLCYLDGGHTWDATGFGFVLVDMLLKPGGWIIFDDLDWTITKSMRSKPASDFPMYAKYDREEKDAPGVRMVFEILLPRFGYVNQSEVSQFKWGVAQKPL